MTRTQKPDLAPATKGERSAELITVIASAAPWIGGPLAEIVGGVATNLKIRRVTDFIKVVLSRVEACRNEASELFVKSEDFADIFEKTAQAVADERDEEKRHLFAEYLVNNVAEPSINYNQRLRCLRLLQEIDTRHIDLITALLQRPTPEETDMTISAPSTIIERRAPNLRGELQEVMHTANTLGLTTLRPEYMNTNMTGNGAAQLAHNVTPLGNLLMKMLTEEE